MSPRVRSRLRLFVTLLRIVVVLSLAVSVIPTVLAASDPGVGASEVRIAPSSEEEEPPTPPTEEATPAPSETPAPTEEVTPEPTEDATPTPPPVDEPTPPADEATPAPTEVVYEPTLEVMLEPAAAGVFPDCGWNCTANDVEGSNLRLSKSQSADIPLDACTPGDVVTAWIWVTLRATTGATRAPVVVAGDLYVDGAYHSSVEHCALDSIGNKETKEVALTSFQWTCGSRVELHNLLVAWTASGGPCPHPESCQAYQPAKCYQQSVAPIAAPLVANFNFDDVCLSDGTVDFIGATTGGEMPYSYAWAFGDGGTSTLQSPSHSYTAAGDYQVTLTVTDAQTPPVSDSQTYTVHVWASPVASFTATPLSGPTPLEVTFSDTSTAGSPNGGAVTAWAWDFGDGGASTAQNPTHTFSAVGTYTVKLTVTDAHGCMHYVMHDVEATAAPGFTVDKRALAPHDTQAALPGDTIYYKIDVVNTGNVALDITAVQDTLIASLSGPVGDSNSNNKLDVGETWAYTGSYEVTDADVCDDIDNTATVYAEYGQWSDDESDSVTVTTDYTADIAIVKEADVETIGVGGTIHYTITVTNEGNVALADVLVSDSKFTPSGPTGDTDGDELLDVDETWVYTGSYNVVESDICAPILNTAEVEAKDPCRNTVDDTSSEVSVDVTYDFDIEIVKTTTTAIGEPGDEITYTITVTNTGDVALSGIIVEDDLTGLYWEVPTLPANGGNASKDTTYTVTEGDLCGDIVNTATATVDDPCGGEGITVSDTVTVETLFSPELTVTKSTEFEGPAKVGDTIEYTIEVANTGDVTVTDLEVTDTLLSSVTYVSGDDNEDEVLDVDETWVYTGSYEVTEADICGDIVNTASATGMAACESPVSDDSNEVTVATTSTPEITVTKSTEFEGPATVGDTIEYMIEVENTGDVSVYDLAVIDAMLADLAYVSGDDNANSVLDVDEVWVYDGSYEVAEQDVCWSGLVNSAEASGLSPCEDVVTDTSNEVTVTTDYTADIAIVKEADVETIGVGGTIHYTITVTNEGNVALADVLVSDSKFTPSGPTGDTDGDELLDVDETWVYTGSYNVVESDICAPILNTAEVEAKDPCRNTVDDTSSEVSVDVTYDFDIEIVKTTTTAIGEPGDEITYTITVTNTGDVALSGIIVEDDLTGLYWEVPTLPANGGNASKDTTYTVTEGDLCGDIVNTATATVDDPCGGEGITVSDTVTVETLFSPELTVTKSTEFEGPAKVGDTIEYTIEVANTGDVTVTDLEVTDTLLSSVTYVSGDDNEDEVLDVDETWVYTGSYEVTEADICGDIVNTASATGMAACESPVSDDSNEVTVATTSTPEITVTKSTEFEGPATVGDTIEYMIEVENTGDVSVYDLAVIDAMLADLAYVSGDDNANSVLDVDEVWVYDGSYEVAEQDVCWSGLVNSAEASGLSPCEDVVTDTSNEVTVTTDYTADIAIVKEADVETIGVGGTIHYTITVTNEGNVALADVLVSDSKFTPSGPTGDTDGDELLDVDETWVYTGSYNVVESDICAPILNTAEVEAKDPCRNTVDDTSSEVSVDVTYDFDIEIVKTTTTAIGEPGDEITYTITVTNTGDVALSGIIVEDDLTGLYWEVPTLPANGGNASKDTTYTVTEGDLCGDIVNTATATVDDPCGGEGITVSDTVTVETLFSPELTVTKSTEFEGPAKVGDTIEYTIEVANTGDVTVTDLEVTDTLLSSVTYVSGDDNEDEVLDVDETWVYTGSYEVTEADICGDIVNTASATGMAACESPVSDDSNEVTVATTSTPEITVTKSTEFEGPATVGDTIEYMIEVENTGDVSVYDLAVIDAMLADLAYVSGDDNANSVLDVDEVWVYDGSYEVAEQDVCWSGLVNSAEASGLSPCEDVVTDTSNEVTVTTDYTADIAIVKEADVETIGVGGTIHYTITVTNEGNVALADVLVSDSKFTPSGPTGDTDGDELLDVDETWVYTGSYNVVESDICAPILNTAEVEAKDPCRNTVDDTSSEVSVDVTYDFDIEIVKTTTTAIGEPGDEITYTITVTNTGDVALSGIIVEDDLTGLYWEVPTLPANGGNASKDTTYTVTEGDLCGDIVNTATATVDDPCGGEGITVSDTVTVETLFSPELTVTKSTEFEGPAKVGDTIEYTIEVANTGDVTVTDLEVTDTLLSSVTYVSGDDNEDEVLDVDETWVYTGSYEVTEADICGDIVNTASATGMAACESPVSDDSNEVTVATTSTPEITVTKSTEFEGPATVGDTIEYMIEVENTGDVSVYDLAVIDAMLADLAYVSGDDNANSVLDVDEVWVYDGSYEVAEQDVCWSGLVNSAEASGLSPCEDVVTDTSNEVTVTTDYTADIAIVKEADVETIGVGGTIHYTITVTNEGNVALADVLVSDSKFTPSGPTGDTDGDELLDVDETWVYTGSYNVVESDICAPILNTAEVEAKDPCRNTVDDTSSEVSVDVTYDFDIEIVKTTTTAIGEPGDEITYTITVTNTGDVALSGIIVEDDLTGLYWEVPTLPANGGNASKDTTYTVTEGDLCGDIVNTATATVDDPCGGEGITVSDTVTVETLFSPELTVTKSTEFEGPAKVGDTIEYTIEVANTGDVTVTDLEVTDTLLSSVTYVSGDDNEDEVLDVDETWVYTGSYEVTEADICGDIVNTASATGMAACESPVSDDSNEVTVATTSTPEITVTKSTEFEGPATVGDTIEYMIEVENTGDVSVYDLAVIDAMLADLAYVSGDDNANSVLDVDEVWVYDGSYEVAEQDVCWSGLVNSAEASGLSPCEDVVTDTSNEVTVTTDYTADIAIVKEADVETIGVGGTIHYTITVTNEGNVALADVLVSDSKFTPSGPTGDTDGDELLDVDETWVYTGSYNVVESDICAPILNTAEVEAKDPCRNTVDDTSSEVSVDVTYDFDIEIVKTTTTAIGEPGDEITYTITVTNTGDVALSGIIVEDDLTGLYWEVPTLPANGGNASKDTTYTVTEGDLCGDIVNTATATVDDPCGGEGITVSDTVTVETLFSPELTVTKSTEFEGPAKVGDTIEYTIEVANTGDVTVTDLEVTDTLLSSVTYVSGDDNEDEVLDVDETWVYTGSYEVTEADICGDIVNTASATGMAACESPVSDDSNEVTVATTSTPEITVTKSTEFEGPATVGDTIEYMIEVENTGDVSVYDLAVIDAMLADLAYVSGDDNANSVLDVDEVWVYDGSYEVAEQDVCWSGLVNSAEASGLSPCEDVVTDTSNEVTVTTDYTADIAIVKEADVETIGVGGTIHYTITVTNEGNVALADVLVSDSKFTPSGPTGDTDGDELLDVDETWVYTGSYNVVESDICAPILNTAEVEAKDPCRNTVDDTSSEVSVDVTYDFDIEIVKTTTTAIGEPGDEITYTITVTNTGDVALSGIIVEDDLTGLYWEVPTLPANGGNASKDTTYTVTEGDLCGDIVNTATATVDDPCGGEGITVSDTVTVETLFSPELTVTKSTEFEGPAKVGDTIEYTIEVANTGDVTVTDLEVTDTLLSSVTYVSGDDNEDEVLDVDETWVYTGSYEVTEADICGDIVNTASATGMAACESPVSDDSNEVTVATTSTPEITVTKSTEFEGPATVGDTIEYMIEVENTGDVSVYDLAVIDAMLADLAYVSGDDNANSVLDVDEVWVYDGSYEVAEQDVCWSGLVNSAEASGLSPCEDVVTDTSNEVTVGMTYHAELTVDKTTTLVGKAKSGDTVQYAIKVTNTGNVTLYDVTVTDLMLGIVADTSIGDLAPDGSETIYGSYKVQSGDKGKSLTNTAVATALDPCEKEVRAEDSVTIQVSKPSVKKPTPVPPTPTPVPTPPLPPVLPPTGVAGTGALAWPLLAGLGATALLAIRLRRRR